MNFVLAILLFSGDVTTQYFPDKKSCEIALEKKIDMGRYKLFDEIECIDIRKPENKFFK